MSDKLTQDFDLFYLELEGKTKHFKDSSQNDGTKTIAWGLDFI